MRQNVPWLEGSSSSIQVSSGVAMATLPPTILVMDHATLQTTTLVSIASIMPDRGMLGKFVTAMFVHLRAFNKTMQF